mgnify:CR=1 FL=1
MSFILMYNGAVYQQVPVRILISYITNIVVSELRETYPEVNLVENSTIYGAMARINTVLGKTVYCNH